MDVLRMQIAYDCCISPSSLQALVAYEAARMPRVNAILDAMTRMPAQEFAHLLEGVSFVPLTGQSSSNGNSIDAASMETGSGGEAGTGNLQPPALAATARKLQLKISL